jgi:hypothetical protein
LLYLNRILRYTREVWEAILIEWDVGLGMSLSGKVSVSHGQARFPAESCTSIRYNFVLCPLFGYADILTLLDKLGCSRTYLLSLFPSEVFGLRHRHRHFSFGDAFVPIVLRLSPYRKGDTPCDQATCE